MSDPVEGADVVDDETWGGWTSGSMRSSEHPEWIADLDNDGGSWPDDDARTEQWLRGAEE